MTLPISTRDDWYRFTAVVLHLGFGTKFLQELKQSGADVQLMPFFAAIEALVNEEKDYLLNIPLEAREVASEIFDEIERRKTALPTRLANLTRTVI